MIFGSFSNTFQTLMIPFNWQQYRLSVGTTAFDVKTNGDQMPSGTFSLLCCLHKRTLPFTTLFLLFNPLRLRPFFFFFLVLFSAKDEKKKLIQDNSVTWALGNLEVNTFPLAFYTSWILMGKNTEVGRQGREHHQTKLCNIWENIHMKKIQKFLL